MRTDKFEKSIRQKLESISPDFQESDWAQMHKYMQAHTPPTFWQQYGSWLGYAAAASVTVAMASMYVGQVSQNNRLQADVKSLQTQIAAISEKTIKNTKPDTVYILQKDDLAPLNDLPVIVKSAQLAENHHSATRLGRRDELTLTQQDPNDANTNLERPIKETLAFNKTPEPLPGNPTAELPTLPTITDASRGTASHFASVKTLGMDFDRIEKQNLVVAKAVSDKMEKQLTNRLSPNQVRKDWMQATANSYNIAALKKTQQVKQSENVIPRLKLKVPYRFGFGLEKHEDVQARTVIGEVVVSKKFSVSAGLSWLKVKPMEFFTEKMFKEKNKEDFKQTHPNQVPVTFVVTNINVEPSLVQIPLTIAYRNEMRNDWTIYAGAGASITLNSKEKISYNCLVPSPRQGSELIHESFERKLDISPVNSVNFSAGIEKVWHPIVFQAEGYIYNYFKPLTPINQRNGPGMKVKLLYQIGKKM
jgi:hypothetical protein